MVKVGKTMKGSFYWFAIHKLEALQLATLAQACALHQENHEHVVLLFCCLRKIFISKLVTTWNLNLQVLVMDDISKVLLEQENALMVSARKKEREKTRTTTKQIGFASNCLMAHCKTTWKLTAVNFIVKTECYIISWKGLVYIWECKGGGDGREKMFLIFFF